MTRLVIRVAALILLWTAGCHSAPGSAEPVTRRILMFPGVANVRFHLAPCVERIEAAYPGTEVDVRLWGWPLLGLPNLMAHDRNRAAAAEFARELADYARTHPQARIDVVGYSGGGGMAAFVVEALPADVRIDRLVIIAAALSPDYPLEETLLPHVREGIVCFASRRDLQVGWGTRHFGTLDRRRTDSAGYRGFDIDDQRVVNVLWGDGARRAGHHGNHLGYLTSGWQKAFLIPALDPDMDMAALRTRLAAADAQSAADARSAAGP